MDQLNIDLDRAATVIRSASALLITAGAGIGVDSGLPDFRGNQGLWEAYPALGRVGMQFQEIANPRQFHIAPQLAWGFYGHRLRLYRETLPHVGFSILKQLAGQMPQGAFIFTSNVDGQFQKAGFSENQFCECHGSIHHLQCLNNCSQRIWSAQAVYPEINEDECLMRSALPRCPNCDGVARPNILMFNDWQWQSERADQQQNRLYKWLRPIEQLVTIELGAGTTIPAVRTFGMRHKGAFVRINPREFNVPNEGDIAIPLGALEALQKLAERL
jgi:NAD-dependent SIR2 family protein deacetylase